MKREPIGIKEMDSMINGGLPSGSIVGISGPPGAGKSLAAIHYILEGARKKKRSLYINLEEPRSNIDNLVSQFSFSKEFFDLEKKGLITIKCIGYDEYQKICLDLLRKVNKEKGIRRIVIDSFNLFFLSINDPAILDLPEEAAVRKTIHASLEYLRRDGLTTLLVLEALNSRTNALHQIPYLIDGMITLDFLEVGVIERRVFVPKMRWTDQEKESRPFLIGKDGLQVIDPSSDA